MHQLFQIFLGNKKGLIYLFHTTDNYIKNGFFNAIYRQSHIALRQGGNTNVKVRSDAGIYVVNALGVDVTWTRLHEYTNGSNDR